MGKLRWSPFPLHPVFRFAQGAGWDVAKVKMVESEKVGIPMKRSILLVMRAFVKP